MIPIREFASDSHVGQVFNLPSFVSKNSRVVRHLFSTDAASVGARLEAVALVPPT